VSNSGAGTAMEAGALHLKVQLMLCKERLAIMKAVS
jgi:hypothetical protein